MSRERDELVELITARVLEVLHRGGKPGEGAGRASASAGRIVAGAAHNHEEPAAHPAGRADIDARPSRSAMSFAAGAREDAELAAHTTIDVNH